MQSLKSFLNNLKCPICQAQIDLMDWKDKSQGRKYNFCCAQNWEHYRIMLIHWTAHPYIEYETVICYDNNLQYWINQYHEFNEGTEIFVNNVDEEHRIIDSKEKKNRFFFSGKMFDFPKSNKEKIINRVNTILVFQ